MGGDLLYHTPNILGLYYYYVLKLGGNSFTDVESVVKNYSEHLNHVDKKDVCQAQTDLEI